MKRRVSLTAASAFFSTGGSNPCVIPQHVLGAWVAANGNLNQAPYNSLPAGIGPFKPANQANPYRCDKIPPNGRNVLHCCNAQVDAATRKFENTYDLGAQQKLETSIFRRVVADPHVFVLAGREDAFTFDSDLTGFHPNEVSQFDDFMNVDI
jgi:hypothetical protein